MTRPRLGAYAPLSASYYDDDAIAQAGEAAELLYVRGLAFCARVMSDGFISDAQVSRTVGVGMRDAPRRARRLVDVGVWERVPGGYVVRSWLKWNRSAEEVGRSRQKDRERKSQVRGSDGPDDDPGSERNPSGIQADSAQASARIPADVPPESLYAGARAGTDPQQQHIHNTEAPPSGAPRRGTRLPLDWQPDAGQVAYAAERGLDPRRTAEDFRDYWHSKAGRDATKIDWSATWRKWCRSEADRRGPQQQRPSTTDQRFAAGMNLARKFAEQEAASPQLRMIPGRPA